MTLKTYTHAPLPFIGQKRRFVKPFKALLNDYISNDGTGWTILDAFGGSGLLAHAAKRTKPAARVIYNDYDGYAERLAHIADTNRLRHIIDGLTSHLPRNKPIPPADRERVRQAIRDFDGYLDLDCLGSWLLFSGKQAPDLDWLLRVDLYHALRRNDYPQADDYLHGLEITRATRCCCRNTWATRAACWYLTRPMFVPCRAHIARRDISGWWSFFG